MQGSPKKDIKCYSPQLDLVDTTRMSMSFFSSYFFLQRCYNYIISSEDEIMQTTVSFIHRTFTVKEMDVI